MNTNPFLNIAQLDQRVMTPRIGSDFLKDGDQTILKEILRIQKLGLVVWSPDSDEYTLILGDLHTICGWSTRHILEIGADAFLTNLVSTSFDGLQILMRQMDQYLKNLSENQLKNFKAIYDYELLGEDGLTRRVCQETSVLSMDRKGKAQYFLSTISNISNLKRAGKQHILLSGGKKNEIYEIDHLTLHCTELKLLTSREREIACLLGKGLLSEEISEALCIAITTVYKHRQNILQKLKTQDTTEALQLLNTLKLI